MAKVILAIQTHPQVVEQMILSELKVNSDVVVFSSGEGSRTFLAMPSPIIFFHFPYCWIYSAGKNGNLSEKFWR